MASTALHGELTVISRQRADVAQPVKNYDV